MIESIDYQFQLNVNAGSDRQLVRFVFQTQESVDDNMHDFLSGMFEHFCNVACHGGFTEKVSDDDLPFMKVVQAGVSGEFEQTFLIEVANLDPGVWRVLSNFFASFSYYSFPLSFLSIVSLSEIPGPRVSATDVWTLPYPQYPQKLPFSLLYEDVADVSRDRLVTVEFVKPPREEELDEIVSVFSSWDELANGGYPDDDVDPIETASDAIDIYLAEKNVIEHPIPNYLGSEAVFDALILQMIRLDKNLSKIKKLIIN